jgi:serine/threonine protein kinase
MSSELVGRVVGNYRMVALLGSGGMGAVYLAEHCSIGGTAAIKVLHPSYAADPGTVARFFNEARAVNMVQHQNILRIMDFVERSEIGPYLVAEHLEGESLDARLRRRGPLALRETAQIIERVASALSAAHAHGIVHRDLKPANIFLIADADHAGEYRVKVLDFGIAKLTHEHQTQTGELMGTPPYMSPEQCHGAKHVDHRSDIYALAVIAYECLCGRPPFTGPGLGAIIAQHLHDAPPPPRALRPELPAAVDTVLLRALAKDPAERPQSAEELGRALATLGAPGVTTASTPPTVVQTSPSTSPGSVALPQVPDHAGGPQPEGADFFVPAPAEIQPLRSAATDLHPGAQLGSARPWRGALLFGLAIGGGFFLAMAALFWVVGAGHDPSFRALRRTLMLNVPVILFVIGAIIGWRRFRLSAVCSYVGERGFAAYTCRGRRENIVSSACLEFARVVELQVTERRLSRAGAYAGTQRELRWYDAAGLEHYRLRCGFDEKSPYPPTALHILAEAAERSWTLSVLPRLAASIEEHGCVRFRLRGADWMELTRDGLRAQIAGRPASFRRSELEPLTVENGGLSVCRLGQRVRVFADPQESFVVAYGELSNARAFLTLAARVLGPALVPQVPL